MAIVKRETDYALRALARLALADGLLPVSALAEGEDVPADFLRKIMQRLNQAGIVESCQGPFGGYRLARRPDRISMLDVVAAMQGSLVVSECVGDREACSRSESCPFRKRLSALQEGLNAELASVRISDAADEMRAEERLTK